MTLGEILIKGASAYQEEKDLYNKFIKAKLTDVKVQKDDYQILSNETNKYIKELINYTDKNGYDALFKVICEIDNSSIMSFIKLVELYQRMLYFLDNTFNNKDEKIIYEAISDEANKHYLNILFHNIENNYFTVTDIKIFIPDYQKKDLSLSDRSYFTDGATLDETISQNIPKNNTFGNEIILEIQLMFKTIKSLSPLKRTDIDLEAAKFRCTCKIASLLYIANKYDIYLRLDYFKNCEYYNLCEDAATLAKEYLDNENKIQQKR